MSADARPGTSSRDPLKLCACIRALYLALIERADAHGVQTVLIETLRDEARQHYYMSVGVSWTLRSLHLPQPPGGLALAFDLAPREYTRLKGWFPGGPLWMLLGEMGTDLGLGWGGDWKQTKDYPHFQLEVCECATSSSPSTSVA